MIVRSIDTNNDWLFGKGRNNYKRDLDAVAQSIKTRLQSFLGDCFFAQTEGIDWFNLLGGKDKRALTLAMASVILNTEKVTRIIDFTLNLDRSNRELSVQYEIETVFGRNTNTFQLNVGAL